MGERRNKARRPQSDCTGGFSIEHAEVLVVEKRSMVAVK